MKPQRFRKESPHSPQSPGLAPATVITFGLLNSPLPVQLGWARALVCGSASPDPSPAAGWFWSRLYVAAGIPPSTALWGCWGAPGVLSPLPKPATCHWKMLPCQCNQSTIPKHPVHGAGRAPEEEKPPCKDLSWRGLSGARMRGVGEPAAFIPPLGRPSSACTGAERRSSSRR